MEPTQVFQVGLAARAVSILINLGLFSQFASDPTAAGSNLGDNILHLFDWGVTFNRLGYDVLTLPITIFYGMSLLKGGVDPMNILIQVLAYSSLVLSLIQAFGAVLVASTYLNAFNVLEPMGNITAALTAAFPHLFSVIPALGFAWYVFDWNNMFNGAEEEEEEVLV